jgi:putative tricarboxylic transport membrane protein
MEYVFLGIIAVFATLFLKDATQYKIASYDTSGGPGIFPKYILILLLVAIAAQIIYKIIKKEKTHFVFFELLKGERGIILGSLIVYLAVLSILGFILSTSIFLIATVNYLYYRGHDGFGEKKSIAIRSGFSVCVAFIIYYVFVQLMHVILPAGIIF